MKQNSSVKRDKKNDIQRDLRQNIHPYLSTEFIKNFNSYKTTLQSTNWEFCHSEESKSEGANEN